MKRIPKGKLEEVKKHFCILKDFYKYIEETFNDGDKIKLYEKFKDLYEELLSRWGEENLSDLFFKLSKVEEKSTVYTPSVLASELYQKIIETIEEDEDFKEKEIIETLDCSAGSGNISFPFFEDKRFALQAVDMDEESAYVFKMIYFYKYKSFFKKYNTDDFLKSEYKVDIVLGNPPYSGHKDIDGEYKKFLFENFKDVYQDKSDLYYAFFKKAHDSLVDKGLLGFITSRYFLEAKSAKGLRKYILDNFKIKYIHDYYGSRPFEAGIDPVMIILKKEKTEGNYEFKAIRGDDEFTYSNKHFSYDSMKLLNELDRRITEVIESKCSLTLGDVGRFSQGVITGLDKAFIIKKDSDNVLLIEDELLYPWIKSLQIKNGGAKNLVISEYLILPPKILSDYPKFEKYIINFKERLSSRREVKKGLKEYYSLQWERKKEDFINERIVFPYKNQKSEFSIVSNVFHSADIYSFITNEDKEKLVELLNSDIYDRYIKTKIKKLGNDLYEYYPNTLKNIRIPDVRYIDVKMFIEEIEKELNILE